MVRSLAVLPLLAAALAGGCLPTEFLQPDTHTEGAAAVPTSPFGAPPQNAAPVFSAKPPPSSSATLAVKVDEIGQRLLTCNPKLGMVPLFLTIGSPQPEMFHQGTVAVYITEGLVRQCKNEAELAALLSVELGRMVSERETMASPETRNPPKQSAMAIPMGNAGQFSGVEQLHETEQARLDHERRRPSKKYVPPDPLVLAGKYLEATGYDPQTLQAVAPLLRQADRNFNFEKQFKGTRSPDLGTPN